MSAAAVRAALALAMGAVVGIAASCDASRGRDPEPVGNKPPMVEASGSAAASLSAVDAPSTAATAQPDARTPRGWSALELDRARFRDEEGATWQLAQRGEPMSFRRALAFAKLGELLGATTVARARLTRIPLAVVASELEPLELVSWAEQRLGFDYAGGVAAMVEPAPPAIERVMFLHASTEGDAWLDALSRPDSPPGPEALRYGEIACLDYLAAHVLRTNAGLDADGRVWAIDNAAAFQPHASPDALRRMTDRLRRMVHFPPALIERLDALDGVALDVAFGGPDFETQLLPRRERVELLERVRTLRSLIRARLRSYATP